MSAWVAARCGLLLAFADDAAEVGEELVVVAFGERGGCRH